MDYEDNDFQSQSFGLAVEENVKFSPGSHSYSLPKFDLDDNLQVHLRFDSLVESEVLLGIRSQEENQWIEDFSTENSALEFSSGAAESRSISRRNNVWSEATSSESVDLLLKSVGQDENEMIMRQAIIEESDAREGMDSLTNQMDPNLNKDGLSPYKTENDTCGGSVSTLDHPIEQLSGLNKGFVFGEDERSLNHSLRVLNSIEEEKFRACLRSGENCNVTGLKEDMNLVDKPEGSKPLDDSAIPEHVQVNPSTASVQSFVSGELNSDAQHRAEGLEKGNAETVGDHGLLGRVMKGQTGEGHLVDTDGNNVGNVSSVVQKVDCMSQITEVSSHAMFTQNSVQIGEYKHNISCKETDMADQFIGISKESSFFTVEGKDTSSVQSADISADASEILSMQIMHASDQTLQGCTDVGSVEKQDSSDKVGHQLDGEISVCNTERLPVNEKEVFQGQGNENSVDHVEHSSSLVTAMCSSTGHESQNFEDIKDRNDGLGASGSSPLLVESQQSCDQVIVETGPSIAHLFCPDSSVLENEIGRFPTDSESTVVVPEVANMESDNILEGVHHLLLRSSNAKDEAIQQKKDQDSPSHVESSLLVNQEENITTISILDTKESSEFSSEWVPCPEFEHGEICDNARKIPVKIVGMSSSSMGICGKICQDVPESDVANVDAQQLCSERLEECPVIHDVSLKEKEGVQVCDKHNNDGVLIEGLISSQTPTHSLLPLSGKSSRDIGLKNLEDGAFENDNVLPSPLTSVQGVSLTGCEGTYGPAALSEGDADGHVLEAESSSLNSNEPNCGSPTIISCSEASQTEKEHQERSMGSFDHIESDALEQEANIARDGAVDPKENDAFEDDRSFTFKVSSPVDLSEKETVSGWKPFPNIQPYKVPQAVGSSGTSSSGFYEMDSKISEDISRGSPRLSGETNASESFKCNSEDKTCPVSRKITESVTPKPKEGKPQNDQLPPYGGEGHQEGVRRSDPNTAVSGDINQVKNVDVSTVHDPKENISAEVDRRFTFEVNSVPILSEKETCLGWKPVHSVQPYEFPQTVGVSPPTPFFISQIDAKVLKENSRESRPRTSGVKTARRSYKGNADDKIRLSSGKEADKENDKGRKVLKETISIKHSRAGGSNSLGASPTSPAAVTQVIQAGEGQAVAFTEGGSIQSSVVTTPQTANLPDLNRSGSSHTVFQQPFTDIQQVQLRAQIFVYGSIIQGTAPDEACMLASFGESDVGRRAWENVWHVAVERFRNQKSPLSNAKTPVHQHTGARATEPMRQIVQRSEAFSTPGGSDSNKFPPVFNPNLPFSSPLWTVSTACREPLSNSMPKGPLFDSSKTLLPLQSYQSPIARQYAGSTSPWPTQVPSPGNWVVTQTAALDASVHHRTLPMSDTVRESPVSHHSGKQHVLPSPFVHSGSPPGCLASNSLVMDATRTTVSPAKHASAESKPRKKRRNVASEEAGQMSSLVKPRRDPVSVTAQSPTSVAPTIITSAMNVASEESGQKSSLVQPRRDLVSFAAQPPTSVATTTVTSAMNVATKDSGIYPLVQPRLDPVFVTAQSPISVATTSKNVASGGLISGSSLVSSAHELILGGGETDMKVTRAEEMCGGIEQAKRQAEDAAALAATAVRHCQSIWSQLAVQKNSGLVSDLEAKLESSAVAIAAAASVAKAAAAVAKVASDAALQAKLMADEALVTIKSGNLTLETSLHDDVKNMGRVTPSSILKGRDQTNNADSVLVAVREAARKRVEVASAAAKRAENLDALLKAAEMTAEAVSQAGTIIAMGEPLPFTLTELVDTGPEGYWKLQHKSSEQILKSNHVHREQTHKDDVKDRIGGPVEEFNEKLSYKNETNEIVELPKGSSDNIMLLVNDVQSGSMSSSAQGLGAQKGWAEHDFSKTIGVIPESQVASEHASIPIINDEYEGHKLVTTLNGNNFEEGSLVEVRFDEEHLRMVWFSAKVLSLKDGKACVSYTEHVHHEGSSQQTEWVPLGDKGGIAPRIRIPHPLSVIKHEGTKKRSRSARGDYTWSVGDKVDAWIRNGWREGIVTEKSKEDETNLTVHFPAQQETSVVRAWNLRPSLIWEDGKWIEWCRAMESNCLSHEGDSLQGKPSKKSRIECESVPAVEAKGKDKITKLPAIMELGKPEALKPLMLSAKEKVFHAGKNTTKDALGRKLTGLQKEGSKINLAVPKPGKKRKFMEVSKVSKATMFKSGKSQGPALFSSRDVVSDSFSSMKKSSTDVAADLHSKGKAAPLGEKFVKNNEKGASHDYFGKFMPNAVEPRRSVRRIQPTSRLLEGLQSSLIVSKIPAASHDKGTKAQQRSSRGRNHG